MDQAVYFLSPKAASQGHGRNGGAGVFDESGRATSGVGGNAESGFQRLVVSLPACFGAGFRGAGRGGAGQAFAAGAGGVEQGGGAAAVDGGADEISVVLSVFVWHGPALDGGTAAAGRV